MSDVKKLFPVGTLVTVHDVDDIHANCLEGDTGVVIGYSREGNGIMVKVDNPKPGADHIWAFYCENLEPLLKSNGSIMFH